MFFYLPSSFSFYPHPPSLLLLILLLLLHHQPAMYLSVPPLSLSPALLLTSSAVLRPLHEANAHSGLAVAACMRSTGGPIKRRQEQETERDAGSARPQGPRRYHNCPLPPPPPPLPNPDYVSRSDAKIPFQTLCTPTPPTSPLGVCPQLKLSVKPTSGPRCVCPLGAACLKNKHTSTLPCVCLQLWLPPTPQKIPQPLYS